MPPSRSRRAVRRRHLRSALLIVVALLSTMLGYFGYGADVAGRGVYEIAIGTLWVCWFGLPYMATTYATWRFGPPRLVQPRLSRPQAAFVRFQTGAEPSLN